LGRPAGRPHSVDFFCCLQFGTLMRRDNATYSVALLHYFSICIDPNPAA
jgi:hypothetical protein